METSLQRSCPHCGKRVTDETAFPGSDWCRTCVETVLEQQDEEANERAKRQVFRL